VDPSLRLDVAALAFGPVVDRSIPLVGVRRWGCTLSLGALCMPISFRDLREEHLIGLFLLIE
jgi:hypothetical protein